MTCKFATVIVTIRARAGLGLTTTLFSKLVLLPFEKILSLALDMVANLDRSEAIGAF